MATTKHSAKNTPTKTTDKDLNKPGRWFEIVCELAGRGISERSIAARLGITLVEFSNLCNWQNEKGERPVADAIALARAEFEISRVEYKDEILNDPESPLSLKYKIVREDLKTLAEWAPATRTVNVTIEKAPQEFSFEAFSHDEQQQIIAAATANETITNTTDGDEE